MLYSLRGIWKIRNHYHFLLWFRLLYLLIRYNWLRFSSNRWQLNIAMNCWTLMLMTHSIEIVFPHTLIERWHSIMKLWIIMLRNCILHLLLFWTNSRVSRYLIWNWRCLIHCILWWSCLVKTRRLGWWNITFFIRWHVYRSFRNLRRRRLFYFFQIFFKTFNRTLINTCFSFSVIQYLGSHIC